MTTLPAALPALLPALIAALIGWRVIRRIRRLVGRQSVRKRRLVTTMIFFPLLIVLLGLTGLRDPMLLAGLAAGVAVGVALAWIGLRTTIFESTPQGCFYTPNRVIGVALSVLFIGRIAYRVGVLYMTTGAIGPGAMQGFSRSPLTLLIFGILAGYHTAHAIGVMRWASKQAGPAAPSPSTPGPASL